MLANLVRKTFHLPANETDNTAQSPKANSNPSPPDNLDELFAGQDGLVVLNNDDPNENRLNLLLGMNSNGKNDSGISIPSSKERSPAQLPMDDVKVDVTLRTQLGQAPALMLLITDPNHQREGTESTTSKQFAICFEVGLNGHISVVETAGLSKNENGPDTEMQGADSSDSGVLDVHKKISRVLEVSQDLGVLVEWVLRWLQQRTGSG